MYHQGGTVKVSRTIQNILVENSKSSEKMWNTSQMSLLFSVQS